MLSTCLHLRQCPVLRRYSSILQASATGYPRCQLQKEKAVSHQRHLGDKQRFDSLRALCTSIPTADGASTAEASPPAELSGEDGEPKKKKGEAQTAKKEIVATVDMLDIRVGQIVSVAQHPDADALYIEEIDIGEEQPRQIVSGLVNFVPKEDMQGRKVLVLANLKPAKLRGIVSSGMVLCASNEAHDKVEPVLVPEGVAVGERVSFEGFEGAPEPVLNPKKKLWEKIAPDLTTNADGVAVYKDIPFMTSGGPITSSLPSAVVR